MGEPTATASELLAVYDAQVRNHVPRTLPAGAHVEHDGPLVRFVGLGHRGFVGYSDLGGVEGDALDALIARQRDYFAARGEGVEWKHHGHDEPADLPDRLRAAGFEPEEQETVVIGTVASVAGEPQLPAGVHLREVTGRPDLDRIAALHAEVWSDDWNWLADELEAEHSADPDALTIVLAETADDEVVCSGWIRYVPDTAFATLWGGSTLPAWRRRGIYRATVAERGRLAAERGYSYLQVDASDDSRPILESLGFVAVTTTTPYVWHPPS